MLIFLLFIFESVSHCGFPHLNHYPIAIMAEMSMIVFSQPLRMTTFFSGKCKHYTAVEVSNTCISNICSKATWCQTRKIAVI